MNRDCYAYAYRLFCDTHMHTACDWIWIAQIFSIDELCRLIVKNL